MELSYNTVLITGGTSGIGLELGKALQNLNNKVILLGRNQEKLDELRKAGFETVLCDLNRQSDIEKTSTLIHNQFPQLNMLFRDQGIFVCSLSSNPLYI